MDKNLYLNRKSYGSAKRLPSTLFYVFILEYTEHIWYVYIYYLYIINNYDIHNKKTYASVKTVNRA